MPLLDKIKRRLLNLWLLEYTLPELLEWISLGLKKKEIPTNPISHAYTWQNDALYFSQIVVLSLCFRTDRRKKMQEQMDRLGLSFTFFDAIHGQSVDIDSLHTKCFSQVSKRYLPKGSIGCALSHAAVWEDVILQGWDWCLILEDDVILPSSFVEEVHQYLPEVPPDFDLLYLGSGKTAPTNMRRFVSRHVFEPFYPREGMYAYVVSAKGAKKLLDTLFPIHLANGGIDTAVGKLVRKRKLQAYHLWPVLCQADLTSPSNVPNPGGKAKPLDEREL